MTNGTEKKFEKDIFFETFKNDDDEVAAIEDCSIEGASDHIE